MKKKILSIVMCVAMLSSMGITVFATDSQSSSAKLTTEALVFSISVPLSLGIEVDEDGIVYTADEFTIKNNSGGQIVVDSITVTPYDAWEIVEYGTDFTTRKVGLTEFTMSLMDDAVAEDGSVELASEKWIALPAFGGELTVSYDADISSQSATLTSTQIATIEFTFDWDSVE